MCGIFGVINTKEKIDEGRVLAARDVLAHRGPDDAGLYLSCTSASIHPNVALAHRRLSIIDLSPSVHQPMVSGKELSAEVIAESTERRPFVSPDESGQAAQCDEQFTAHYVIVFNGEIYNYRDLFCHSGLDPESMQSNSDTEVILNLYAQHGKDCFKMLRGMFAFAIWDDKGKTLFAARDRFGIKPFYYYKNDESFVFASELKAIKHYVKNLTINNDALDAFLRTGSVPAPLTIYNEVAALLPGHYLTINNAQCTINNYWKFSDLFLCHPEPAEGSSVFSPQLTNEESKTMDSRFRENDRIDGTQTLRGDQQRSNPLEERDCFASFNYARNDNERESSLRGSDSDRSNPLKETDCFASLAMTCEPSLRGATHLTARQERRSNLPYNEEAKKKIRTALLDTIKAHLVADVEVGAFLSGGIDSTAIVSLMRQVGKDKIKTVSIVFPDSKFDESKYSRLAAKKYNTEHIEIPFYEKDLLDDFDKIMASMDQPTIDGINTYFVSKAAKHAGLKVVLSGLGGDELFGGYPSFNLILKYQRIKNLPFAKMFMKLVAPLLKNKLPAKAIEYMKNPDEPNAEYKLIRGLFTDEELIRLGWNIRSEKSDVKREMKNSSVISTTEGGCRTEKVQVKKKLIALKKYFK